MKHAYICDNCQKATELRSWIFHCIECGREICETCMHGWATCKTCAVGKTNAELEARFEKANA